MAESKSSQEPFLWFLFLDLGSFGLFAIRQFLKTAGFFFSWKVEAMGPVFPPLSTFSSPHEVSASQIRGTSTLRLGVEFQSPAPLLGAHICLTFGLGHKKV